MDFNKHKGPDAGTVSKVLAMFGDKLVSLMAGLLAAALILYSGYVIYDYAYAQNQAFSNSWDVMQYRPVIIEDGDVPLSSGQMEAINEDYRCWLTIYDTTIDYPVLQSTNDIFYASHDVYKKSSLTGSAYLAAANTADLSDSYDLFYGHHMDNGAMFGALDDYVDKGRSFFNEHRKGIVVTRSKVYDVNLFAVTKTDAYDSAIYTVGPSVDAQNVINHVRQASGTMIFDEEAVKGATKIMAMSTCANATTSGRLVVLGTMTERANVKTSGGAANLAGPTAPSGADDPGNNDDPANPAATDPTSNNGGNGGNGGSPSSGNAGTPAGATSAGGSTASVDGAAADNGAALTDIEDQGTPLAGLMDMFRPTGGSVGDDYWALINLVCLIVTLYILFPLAHLKAKFSRKSRMNDVNGEREERLKAGTAGPEEEEGLYYEVKEFARRFKTGLIVEIILAVLAAAVFILTENLKMPMALIDKWTPVMILMMLTAIAADIRLVRYRGEEPEEEMEENTEEHIGEVIFG